ncbi:uncharacterized protein I303_100435 [Kwoniella dejecticola CBS 10117]|uniref:Uncharacterized protein n=1 Tax=Kwoniella dejecticola CBS 10117 TaxID=1296121 RepID=A0AAJ8KHR4_9TREE
MDGFPVYEDTYPPEYNQEPYLQYADDYIPEQPAYAEYEEIEGDIDILDEFEEEEDDLPEAWIPYPTYSDLLPGNGNQQVIIGASFPQAADLKQHYCDLYPEDCAKGLVERNGTISGNGTLEGDVGTGTGLNHVDLSGCGLALILLFLILLGLNSGLGGGEGDKGKARDAERPRSEKDRGQEGGKAPKDETPEERAKRKNKERRQRKTKQHGETPEERAARHKKAQEEKDKKRAAAKAQAEKDAKKKAAEEEAEKKKRKRDGQRSETPEERAERHKRKNETPEETAKRHKREKADREERAKRKNETPEETAARHKREKAEKANRGKGDQPAAVGDDSKSSSWLSPPLVLGLLLLLGLVALGGAGKAMQLPQGVPAWSDWRSPLPSWSDWTPPSFFHVPRTPIGGGLLNPDGGILGGIGSRSSPPLVRTSPRFLPSRSKSRWLVNEPAAHRDGPQININNVNSQGSGDPISFGSTSSGGPKVVVEEEVIVDAPPVMVQEKIWEPLSFRFTGPSNPDRLLNMLLTILLVSLPLLLDFIKDYPENAYTQPNYISSPVQLLILGALILLGLLIADYHFGWTTTIAPYAEVSIEGVQGGLTPVLVGAVETTEQLVWGLEDVLFGESRVLLGMGLAALGVFFLSQREPSLDIPETEFARPTTQALVFLGALLLGMFFWNA